MLISTVFLSCNNTRYYQISNSYRETRFTNSYPGSKVFHKIWEQMNLLPTWATYDTHLRCCNRNFNALHKNGKSVYILENHPITPPLFDVCKTVTQLKAYAFNVLFNDVMLFILQIYIESLFGIPLRYGISLSLVIFKWLTDKRSPINLFPRGTTASLFCSLLSLS